MYSRDVEEMVWHFIGYIHMADVTAKARISYDVFRQAKAEEDEAQDQAQSISLPRYSPDNLESEPAWAWYVPTLWLVNYTPGDLRLTFDQPEVELAGLSRFGTPAFAFPVPPNLQFVWTDLDLEITISYSEGGHGQSVFQVHQLNYISNVNMLSYGEEGSVWDFHDPDAVDRKLEDAFSKVADWTPEGLMPADQSHHAFIDMVLEHSGARAEKGPDQDPASPPVGTYVGEAGTYVQYELQAPGAEGEGAAEDAFGGGTELPEFLSDMAENANQIMSLGGNTAINVAFMVDAAEGWGSIVILGDYHKLDGIFQFNIYEGSTQVATDGALVLHDWSAGKSTAQSIATFANDNETAFGNAALAGVYPGLNWNVHVHDGDYWNISLTYQENWIWSENFAAHIGQGWQSDVAAGHNQAINFSETWNFGYEYDLIIVAGNKYDYNLIFQTNIVINDNIVFLLLDDSEGAEGGVAGGGNELVNEASIINYGNGDMFNAMTPEVEAFVQLLADKQGSIPIDDEFIEFASTLPGNGSNEFNVLYVTGDYYSLKLIDQMNVIVDTNVGIQTPPDHDHGFEGDGWSQFVETGGNTAANLASIVNLNSTSEFQYLAGDKYHDMLLLQEDFVAEDHKLVYEDTQKLVPEVIAFLESPEEANEDGYPVWTENQAGQDEGFSGVLT